MKILPGRPLRALLLAIAIPALLVGLASLPWHGERPRVAPRVIGSAAGTGPLEAGVARVGFHLPERLPIAGFARWSWASDGVRDPVGARALVLAVPGCKIALVATDLLLVPEALEEAVRAQVKDLGLAGLVLAATHTHAGPGGYWHHPFGERLATGPYDDRLRDVLVAAIAEAIRQANAELEPSRLSVARGLARDLARSRSGGLDDARMTVLRVDRGGAPLAELLVFPAHPTILGKDNRKISGDWPSRFLSRGSHGLRLFVQGAIGDQSVSGGAATKSPEAYGDAVSAKVDSLSGGPPAASLALAFAAVEVSLPAPDVGAAPAIVRRAARTVAHGELPPTARVEAIRLGDLVLVAVPAEPTGAVAAGWRAALPNGAEIVSLAGGYLGYVELPSRMARGEGETVRTYFGPDLALRLGEAAWVAADAVTRPVAAARGR